VGSAVSLNALLDMGRERIAFMQQDSWRKGELGLEALCPRPNVAAKPKAKKRRVSRVYHRFCGVFGNFVPCTISGGVRRVQLLHVVDEKFLTTTC